ncbi:hypothetical protein N3K66_003571 [Trichothecium roseum]|uniref:Uncharacterized protein n=1 Tax=Trichothecium roseum TaxID=47278 RepID=A0ACC0V7C6_9HYPO|nr:hypothetical protein N3K66_003571 [Trichothecium roseum]
MGWLWASSSSSDTNPKQQAPPPPLREPASTPKPTAAPNEPSADPEVQKFLDLFSSPSKDPSKDPSSSSPSQQTTARADAQPATGIASWFALKKSSDQADEKSAAPPPALSPLAESLLPTEMSCRQAFDLAWSCNSLGGQWNAVYRHGEMRSCSEQWDDFWFCMRTKSYTGDLKANAVRAHYRAKEHAKYGAGKPSSEDVWESRPGRLPSGAAFSHEIEVPSVSDEEWRRGEAERRQKIRESVRQD